MIKQTGKTLICLSLIVIFFALSKLKAHEHEIDMLQLYSTMVPALCGTGPEIEKYMKLKGMTPKAASLGRTGSKPDGEPVYILTHWFNNDSTEVATTVSVPNGLEHCIMYHGFDLFQVEGI